MKIKIILTQKTFDQAMHKQQMETKIIGLAYTFCYHLFKIIAIDKSKLPYGNSGFDEWKKEIFNYFLEIYIPKIKSGIKLKARKTFDLIISYLQTVDSVELFTYNINEDYGNLIKDSLKKENDSEVFSKIDYYIKNDLEKVWANIFNAKNKLTIEECKNLFYNSFANAEKIFN